MRRLLHSHNPRRPFAPLVIGLIACTPALILGWSASGTVTNSSGSPLAGVTVTVKDSSLRTTTGANGTFELGSPTGLSRVQAPTAWRTVLSGRELTVMAPSDGPLEIAIFDGLGHSEWKGSARSEGGIARLELPASLRAGVGYLKIRSAQSHFVEAIFAGAHGDLKLARHIAALRSLATYPILQFQKSGYRDTTHAMTTASASGIVMAMKDTGSVPVPCPSPILSPKDYNRTVASAGKSRTYVLHVPAKYNGSKPAPLMFDFHGLGGSGSQEQSAATYKAQTDPDGVITAYPDGLAGPVGKGWNVGPCCVTGVDDVAFVKTLIADIQQVACIDPKRIYAVGFSNGGGLSHKLACEASDVFAAVGPMAFNFWKEIEATCAPKRPITVVQFAGTADPAVAYNGGTTTVGSGMSVTFIASKATQAKWAKLNQCTGSASAEDANGCSTYANCAGGVQVTLCTKQGGGHEQGNGSVGWPILKKYTLP